MKAAAAIFALCLSVLPLHAQETAPVPPSPPAPESGPGEMDEGIDLIEEGAKLLLRGLMSEMEPALSDMEQALREMEPAVRDLLEMIGDIRNYHPPERLPNGDILIRRKSPLDTVPEGEIDL